jgi:3-oxoadipate CoA-transferase beta subunit
MKTRLEPETMGMRVYKEFPEGAVVNLGAGLPSYAFQAVVASEEKSITLHSENGVLGFGRPLRDDEKELWDVDLRNATGNYVTYKPGMCIVDHREAFDMIRGGHIDITILGAYQVSEKGDLANWTTGGESIGSIGGAVDLATSVKTVFVMMEHITKGGEPRILKECTYPLTAPECVDMIFTDLAVIKVTDKGLVLKEIAPGWSVEEVQALTQAKLHKAEDLKEIQL